MFCAQCGGELQINQRFCSGCGKEVRGQVSFAGPRRGRVESHIRLLGIFWLALAALDAVGGGGALVLANTLFSRWAPEGMRVCWCSPTRCSGDGLRRACRCSCTRWWERLAFCRL